MTTYKLSVPVVGEQKLPKRGDPVLIMALIYLFYFISSPPYLFQILSAKEAVNAKIEGRSISCEPTKCPTRVNYAQHEQVEYRLRWVPLWPTQTRFPVEYGLKSYRK